MTAQAIIPVPFRNTSLVLLDNEGQPYVPMRPVVEGMGLDWKTQFRKFTGTRFNTCVVEMTTQMPGDDQRRAVTCLPLRKLAGWMMTIHPNKVRPELRETIIAFQNECDDVLWQHWVARTEAANQAHALPAGLTPAQQRHIQKRVSELAPHYERGFAGVYGSIKNAFRVGTYKDVPASQFAELCEFLGCEPIEGEFLGRAAPLALPTKGTTLTDDQIYTVWFVCQNFSGLYDVYRRHNLYTHLTGLGSRAGIEMHDRFTDGMAGGVDRLNVELAEPFAKVREAMEARHRRWAAAGI